MIAARKTKDSVVTASAPITAMLRSLPRLDDGEAITVSPHSLSAELVNPLTEKRWENTVRMHPDANIFHSTAWARVLVDTYGHRPCYVELSLDANLQALVPLMEVQSVLTRSRGVCLPFSDCCGPLLFGSLGSDLLCQKLQHVARERCWSYFEIRSHSKISAPAASESYYGHFLDLRIGRDALMSNFSSSAQRAVRKARRSGLSVSIRSDAHAMAAFYKLHVRTRRRHGVPPQPQSFFVNIQRHIIDAGLGFMVIVELQERPLAAAMFFKFGRHAIYKFGASDERMQAVRANNLVMGEAIRTLADSGVETLHFGRTDKDNEGLRRFKASWGATEEEIHYVRFDMSNSSWKHTRDRTRTFHKRFFRALPPSLNKLAGAIIYPHLD